jgi:hypothetical protein
MGVLACVLSRVTLGAEDLIVVRHDAFYPLEVHVTLCDIVEKLSLQSKHQFINLDKEDLLVTSSNTVSWRILCYDKTLERRTN